MTVRSVSSSPTAQTIIGIIGLILVALGIWTAISGDVRANIADIQNLKAADIRHEDTMKEIRSEHAAAVGEIRKEVNAIPEKTAQRIIEMQRRNQ